ncbi:MAG: DEAD/DEAH box helicase family protein [Candidatus Obscuribacterales bacterium]
MDISSIVATQSCLSSLEEEIRDETKEEEHEQLLDSAPSETDETQSQPTLIVKNLAQMLELKALEHMLTTIYSSTKPLTLIDLLEKIQCDSMTVNLLKHLAFAPICSGLLQGLKQSMTITDEGKRLFEISQIYFGFYGHTGSGFIHSPSSNTAISVQLKLSAAEVKQATIRLKARLQAPSVRQLVEQILRQELALFKNSGLYQAMLQQKQSFMPIGPSEGQWTISSKISPEIEVPRLVQKTLWALTAENTVNIVGGTGTGKTSIASEVALKLSQGQRVLLVTHSRLLAAQLRFQHEQYLRDQESKRKIHFEPEPPLNCDGANAQQGSLTISTFHALCHSAALTANLTPPRFRSTKIFNEIFPELLLEANRLHPELKFDAIIVDEGHSFGTNLWRALKHCLIDQAKGIFVFCYDPQLLAFNRNSVVPQAATTIELKVSFKSNLDLLASNETSELYEVSSVEEQTDAVQFLVDSLLSTGQYRPNDLAILSACSDKSHRFKFAGGVKVSQQPVKPSARAALLETSLFQFRALTAKVVILIDLFDEVEKLSDWKFQYFCYLVWGRATEKLIIVGREETMTKLLPREITTLATSEILPGKGRKP